jgi:redox-sensitive bicupin YhaK (pirin superfamily)
MLRISRMTRTRQEPPAVGATPPPTSVASPSPAIDLVIAPRARDLGGFSVRRALPFAQRRLVGPFIFFDHMGPAEFPPGGGLDVRPHPHVCLATVTYLFEGAIVHRDSLGSCQTIVPGDVNWMTAGHGIVHSERTDPERRRQGARLHGIQAWVALPTVAEEIAPEFQHHPADAMPLVEGGGVRLRVIAGEAYGVRAPVTVHSSLFYVDAQLATGSVLDVPDEHAERAVYVVSGEVECDGAVFGEATMLVLRAGSPARVTARGAARVMLLGGSRLDGERHIEWNFVASTPERIERAKADWRAGAFPKVPGDEVDFIPLP